MANIKFNSNFWVGFIVMFLVMIGLFYIARGIFTILAWAAPVLIIATLILRHQVILSYGRMLINLTRRNPLMGIVAIVLTIVGFPVVAFALFGKALLDRKLIKLGSQQRTGYQDEYTDYEVLDEEPLDLPNMERPSRSSSSKTYRENPYDDLV